MSFVEAAVSNAIVATIPALLAIVCVRLGYKPALVRALWLLVFIKLVTPPLAPVPCWKVHPAVDVASSQIALREPVPQCRQGEPRSRLVADGGGFGFPAKLRR